MLLGIFAIHSNLIENNMFNYKIKNIMIRNIF